MPCVCVGGERRDISKKRRRRTTKAVCDGGEIGYRGYVTTAFRGN